MNNSYPRPRVVITGLGAVTPLGATLEQYWDGLLQGRSGIRRITQFDASNMPCQIAGEIPDFNVELYMDRKEARRTARACQVALAAAIQAVKDAGLPESMPEPERAGVLFGTVLAGIDKVEEGAFTLRDFGPNKVSPFMIPTGIPNTPAFMIAHRFQCIGPNNTISTACATGTHSIGDAFHMIARGDADAMIAGGTESTVTPLAIGGFAVMKALSTRNDDPKGTSRPF